jgi:hypothetical protein
MVPAQWWYHHVRGTRPLYRGPYFNPSFLFDLSLPLPIPSYIEEDVQNAIAAYNRGDHVSISRTAAVFSIPPSALKDRLRKVKCRNQSYEKQQLLSSIEENELATWISNASKLGVPTPLPLVKNLAEEIRSERFASRGDSSGRPIYIR